MKRLWIGYFLVLGATTQAFSCSLNRGNRGVAGDDGAGASTDGPRGRARLNGGLSLTDQSESEADIQTTKQIRQALLSDEALSFSAKNVQVITIHGKVTLRGPVKTAEERTRVGAIAAKFTSQVDLDNQLEVTH